MFTMGQKVSFHTCYSRKCSQRFTWKSDAPFTIKEAELKSLKTGSFKGFVVGTRSVIMSNYQVHSGGEGERNYATGVYEKVLLVSETPFREPLIVRSTDVQII